MIAVAEERLRPKHGRSAVFRVDFVDGCVHFYNVKPDDRGVLGDGVAERQRLIARHELKHQRPNPYQLNERKP